MDIREEENFACERVVTKMCDLIARGSGGFGGGLHCPLEDPLHKGCVEACEAETSGRGIS